MNLRDKLRAVGGTGGQPRPAGEATTDCRHFAVYREAEEFPGAYDLTRETLQLMSDLELPEILDPRKILYLDTETTGLGGSGTVAFLVGMGYLTDHGFEVQRVPSFHLCPACVPILCGMAPPTGSPPIPTKKDASHMAASEPQQLSPASSIGW